MWMSEAFRLIASVRIMFTSLTTGRVGGLVAQLGRVEVVVLGTTSMSESSKSAMMSSRDEDWS